MTTEPFFDDEPPEKSARASPSPGDRLKEQARRHGDDLRAALARFRAEPVLVHRTRLLAAVRGWARIEAERAGLFVPVCLAIGVGAYFSLLDEPGRASIFWVVALALSMRVLVRNKALGWRLAGNAVLIAALGFSLGAIRTHLIAAPLVPDTDRIRDVTGTLVSREARQNGTRYVIAPTRIEGLAPDALPRKIRVTWRGEVPPPNAAARLGEPVQLRAGLSPPPPPVHPGGYDFGRNLFFQGFGAVGFALGPPLPDTETGATGLAETGRNRRFSRWVEAKRTKINNRITSTVDGENGAILAAIVTGKRGGISEDAQNALRDSGLAHLLAISGLHMGLATGLLFFAVRMILVQSPALALRLPVKKIAASIALFGGLTYLFLSGTGWSARRAFIMTSIFLLAIIVDRRALSLRNVAIAATIVLVLTPEALLHAGFQMSFGAVTALIAAVEAWSRYRRARAPNEIDVDPPGPMTRSGLYIGGIAVTDTIAALATAPFALYHFHRSAVYSLIANIAAMPLMGLWVMPAIVMAMVSMPFGLDGPWWHLAGLGVGIILAIGHSVSDWPGAVMTSTAEPMAWLVVLTLGGVIFLLLRTPLRFVGLTAIPIAAFISFSTRPPDLFIAREASNVGVHLTDDGHSTLAILNRRRDRFSQELWGEALGIDTTRTQAVRMENVFPCDDGGCVYRLGRTTIAIAKRPEAIAADCTRADIVVSTVWVSRPVAANCGAQLIDPRTVRIRGAMSLWISPEGDIHMRGVGDQRAGRPWGAPPS